MSDLDDFLAQTHPGLIAGLQRSTTATLIRNWKRGRPRTQ
jgi:hypothetical protein